METVNLPRLLLAAPASGSGKTTVSCAILRALVKPLPVSAASARIDLPACLLVGAIAVIPAMVTARFRRWQGIALLAVYGGYVLLTCSA